MRRQDEASVVFRVDSGTNIGAGHLRRCMAMASFLRKNGFRPIFISRKTAGEMTHLVKQEGFEVVSLVENETLNFSVFHANFSQADYKKMVADAEESATELSIRFPEVNVVWAVVDHMLIREPWQKAFRKRVGCRILAIDGLADYAHDADILLDPQISDNLASKWSGLLPEHCAIFSGPSRLPLSSAFELARDSASVRLGPIERIMICFGGTDPQEIVCRTVKTLLNWFRRTNSPEIVVDVVVPAGAESLSELRTILKGERSVHLSVGINDLSYLMQNASFAIGGGGIMLWERCLLGLPSIVVPLADNQKKPIARLEAQGAVVGLSTLGEGYESELLQALDRVIAQPGVLRDMSENALKVMSGWPATDGWLHRMKGRPDA